MIYYYSGTGNSAYVARKLADKLGVDAVDIGERIKTGVMETIKDDTVILVTPTYCWRVPRIVEEYWNQIEVEAETLYLVMTCGSGIGGAPVYEEKMAREKNLVYGGAFEVIMPENYIAMFDAPKAAEARAIIAKADKRVDEIADRIAAKKAGAKKSGPSRPAAYIHQRRLLRPFREGQALLRQGQLHWLRRMRTPLHFSQCEAHGGAARVVRPLYPLHGLHELLPRGGHRVRKEDGGKIPLHIGKGGGRCFVP